MIGEEKWLSDVKRLARFEAEYFVDSVKSTAERNDLDPDWFVNEVIRNARIYMKEV